MPRLTPLRIAVVCVIAAGAWLVASNVLLSLALGPEGYGPIAADRLEAAVVLAGGVILFLIVRRLLTDIALARDAAEARARDLELHVAADAALLDASTEADLADSFCKVLVRYGARCAWVGVAAEDGRLAILARAGEDGGYLDDVEIRTDGPHPLAMGPSGRAFRDGRSYVADDIALDPNLAPWRERQLAAGFRSSVSIPLTAEGERLGVMSAYWPSPSALRAEGLSSLQWIAADLARGMLAIRRRTELAAAGDRLRRVLDASPNPILLIDSRGVVADANPNAATAFDYPLEQLIGIEVGALVPTDERRHPDLVASYLRAPKVRRVGEVRALRARRRDGSVFPADISLGPVWIGGALHVVVTVVDLTARHELEARLFEAQKMEVMGLFANILAHDFRNYLAAIGGFAEVLATELPSDNPSRPDVDQIRVAVTEASALIRNVLAFARPPQGEAARADLRVVLAGVRPLVELLVDPQVRVEVHVPDGLPAAAIEPSLLGQAVLNLATNARDAMPDGGTLTLSVALVEDPTADGPPGERSAEPFLELSVSDTGTGLAPEAADHLFEAFFTTKESLGGGRAGTGLGLASVRYIIGRAGGRIAVESSPGAGTTFRLVLPIAPPEAAPAG